MRFFLKILSPLWFSVMYMASAYMHIHALGRYAHSQQVHTHLYIRIVHTPVYTPCKCYHVYSLKMSVIARMSMARALQHTCALCTRACTRPVKQHVNPPECLPECGRVLRRISNV